MTEPKLTIRGVDIHPGYLKAEAQRVMADDIRRIASAAPLFSPMTPYGKPMRVRMTSAGKYGWFSDRSGYRYVPQHPEGRAWPDIPDSVLSIWRDLVSVDRLPDCCLVNYYGEETKMGMHQDRDEADFAWPVLSVSLGDEALFRIGNTRRGGKTESVWLRSGDVVVMGGDARLVLSRCGSDPVRFFTAAIEGRSDQPDAACGGLAGPKSLSVLTRHRTAAGIDLDLRLVRDQQVDPKPVNPV